MKIKCKHTIPIVFSILLICCFFAISCKGQNKQPYKKSFWNYWKELKKMDTLMYTKNKFDLSDKISRQYLNVDYMRNDSTQYFMAALYKAENYTDFTRMNIGILCSYSHIPGKYYKLLDYKQVEAIDSNYAAVMDTSNSGQESSVFYKQLLNSVFLTFQNGKTVIPLMMISYDPVSKKINSFFNMLLYAKESEVLKMNHVITNNFR